MSLKDTVRTRLRSAPRASLFDLTVAVVLLAGGLAFHWDFQSWTVGLIGECPFGDAECWWDGALRVSEANISNYPGEGYRPGFFVLAGLTLPVLSPSVAVFHKFLLTLILSAFVLLYLALRSSLGRLGASFGVALAVFNPYIAQWLATPTTEGLGLLLHVLSLSCLLLAVSKGLHRSWLCGFGFFFALGTLTRPLLTPFIGGALLCLLLLPRVSFRQRAVAAGLIVLAFLFPTFSWMAVQRVVVKRWSISTNDASAFYAASSPLIQTWSPNLDEAMKAQARWRFQVDEPTRPQIDSAYWKATIENYKANARYHLDRLLPHVWTMACFPPVNAPSGTARWQTSLLAGLAGALCLGLLLRREWWRAGVMVGAAACLWLSPQTAGFLTCAGAVLALLRRPGEAKDLCRVLLACYWICGVICLYLVGGTCGPPLSVMMFVNALGYRLYTQVAFSGGLLAGYFLCQIASLHLSHAETPEGTEAAEPPPGIWDRFFTIPNPLAGRLIQGSFAGIFAGALLVYAAGTFLVIQRACAHANAQQLDYPDLSPVADYCTRTLAQPDDRPLPIAQDFEALSKVLDARKANETEYVLSTGQIGPLLWRPGGQDRTLFRLHLQRQASPSVRGKLSEMVQVSAQFSCAEWAGAKGAFLLSAVHPGASTLTSGAARVVLRAYVPLAENGLGYDLDRAIWFPLNRSVLRAEEIVP
jgi:Dolichyl-phosphate-mannose-protein mannosyltransferase